MASTAQTLEKIESAASAGKISSGAVPNLRNWLTEDRYAQYVDTIVEHVEAEKWQALDDAFWTIIPFGTGGRRGRMYPIGSNAINDRTIGESAQGVVDYILSMKERPKNLSCAIAYDTRHQSRHFAELCASIMVAGGFKVYLLDDYRATPQLSYAVRHFQCSCGIMVTASHNPPSDNAVKVYWSTGGQILPPHDKAIIDRVMTVDAIHTVDFETALADGRVQVVTDEIDREYLKKAAQFGWEGSRDCKIIYSPLHGVGSFAVLPLLKECGFDDVEEYGPHAEPSGDFPNVPGHVSNPENTKVFDAMIEHAKQVQADLILATDPDCDRMGCAAPLTTDPTGPWKTLNGNQLGAILTDYVLRKIEATGNLKPSNYVIKTLVTTELIRRIAHSYEVRCEANIHVGFKWIAGLIDALGPDDFLFGTEESHGYLIGTYCRDKDGAVACLLMSQLAADLKAEGVSMHQRMDELLTQHGCHVESLINVQMEGSEGMAEMKKVMAAFRSSPPKTLAGIPLKQVRDYDALTVTDASGNAKPLDAPPANMIILDLAEPGNYVAVRPSGTEPKVKFYFFTYLSPENSTDLDAAKAKLNERIEALSVDLKAFVGQ
jgi:phosphoglucomutase/phosphomannomutase